MTQPPEDATRPISPTPPPPPLPPPPAAPPAAAPQPADRTTLVSLAFAVATIALTVVALAVMEDARRGYEVWTTWSVVATLAALVHLLPVGWKPEPRTKSWDAVALATGVLLFFWVAAFLPSVTTGTGFAMTAAVACAVAHCWVLPGRRT
ncbi:hypothetical protein G5V58_14205 [Nocardioides anomalus]|uniref:Uncharacterized protein n=1 Tax=Nocardioides anomalus TaxID=2712223 RepID=A0A6G6WEV8_9ACTN|nr:hypothetical protein [Nocardioides anomalus]QIG43764.1 hypothetical protein G5V58_14205 [Nocardioides anomalus]